jgi:hypothetical protein
MHIPMINVMQKAGEEKERAKAESRDAVVKKKPGSTAGDKEEESVASAAKSTPKKQSPPVKNRAERRAERTASGAPVGWRDLDSVRGSEGGVGDQPRKKMTQVFFSSSNSNT